MGVVQVLKSRLFGNWELALHEVGVSVNTPALASNWPGEVQTP
jgi:hypothetical protein